MAGILERLKNNIDKCARCGKCRTACPVFNETLDEKFVSRARAVIANEFINHKISDIRKLNELWKTCIKCTRCTDVCPSGVKGDQISYDLASFIADNLPDEKLRFFFRTVLPNRSMFDAFIIAAQSSQKLLPSSRKGTLRHLPLAVMGKTIIPQLARVSALQALKKPGKLEKPKGRVALFLGCAMNYVYPKTAQNIIRILNSQGIEVIVPQKQVCCGTPALTLGYSREAILLAKKNQEVFSRLDVDAIVTGCASCALSLSVKYNHLLGENAFPKTYEFSKYLHSTDYTPSYKGFSVGYHDPCHLRYGLQTWKEPREILRKAGILVEVEQEDKCCGGGGSFSFYNPELSQTLGDSKIPGFLASEASMYVTTCPGCIMQLRECFERNRVSQPVIHLADYLCGEHSG